MTLTPETSQASASVENRRPDQPWQAMRTLALVIKIPDLQTGLLQALIACNTLTGASLLGIYLADEKMPGLTLRTQFGPANILPAQLPPQDLIQLRKPTLWTHEKRSASMLHRIASQHKLNFLASIPLGQEKALIGLLVAADQIQAPSTDLLPALEVVEAILSTSIQQNSGQPGLRVTPQSTASVTRHQQAILSAVQEAVIFLQPDLRIQFINPSAEALLGYTNKEAGGQPVQNILIGTASILPVLEGLRPGNSINLPEEIRLFRRNGETFAARIAARLIDSESGSPNLVISFQDLSNEEQIRLQAQQYEQRAMLGEVTSVLAHEVRNPINNISTGLQLMSMNLPADHPLQPDILRLQQDCDRLEELMKSILAFSRSGSQEMQTIHLDLLIRRWMDRMQPRIARFNIQPHLFIEPDLPPVSGNPKTLEQVFTNLVTNAIQAMKDQGGSLAVKVQKLVSPESSQTIVEISIADTGPGIPAELLERIFQPFFSTNRDGTGLGLAITKRIITAHKGSVNVESFPGGTIFYVRIPAADLP
jgi:PAS domain S-box-containing protein